MRLSIIVPAHNEEKTILKVLEKLEKCDVLGMEKEIIVVNDGSDDNTGMVAEQWASLLCNDAHCIVVHHEKNLGKGAGIQTGLKEASGDYVIIQDADLEYEPGDISKLLHLVLNCNPHPNPLPEGEGKMCFAVFGARGYKAYPKRGFHYVIGAWMLTTFYNILYHQKLTDLYTCYKLIPLKVFRELNIKSKGFEFEAEVACKLSKKGVIIKEVPISYNPRSKKEGKHIGLKDAVKGFWSILKFRF